MVFRDVIVNDPRQRLFDMGAFRGFEDVVFGDTSATNTNPSASNSSPSTDWLNSLFDAVGKTVGGVATVVGGAINAGNQGSGTPGTLPINPATGRPYTPQEWAARPQGGFFSKISPLMIGGIAVLGIGAVVLLSKPKRSAAVAGFAGFGKRKRRRAKSRRR